MNTEIILLDDDQIVRTIFEKMANLVEPNCKVTPFGLAEKALAYLAHYDFNESSALLILDINLPEMNAWQFMDKLIASGRTCPQIILITNSVSALNPERADTYAPVIGFFEKPITIEIIHRIFELIKKD